MFQTVNHQSAFHGRPSNSGDLTAKTELSIKSLLGHSNSSSNVASQLEVRGLLSFDSESSLHSSSFVRLLALIELQALVSLTNRCVINKFQSHVVRILNEFRLLDTFKSLINPLGPKTKRYFCTSIVFIVFKNQMLQAARTDLFNPLVRKAHNVECQNLQFQIQIKPEKDS